MNTENIYTDLPREEIIERIQHLKNEKNAVILTHNYQILEVLDVGDFRGDSLKLSIEASRTDADIIVFCGVDFMAESAKILSPGKKVVLPDKNANCPMAHMIDRETLLLFKEKHPGVRVVTYVNTSAEVKAESDICCTSSNAVAVVNSLGPGKILFTPDRNLALYVKMKTDADIIPWGGFCYVHDAFTPEDVNKVEKTYPDAIVVVHPECRLSVIELADNVASTSGMFSLIEERAKSDPERPIIIGTEVGLVNQAKRMYPHMTLIPLNEKAVCKTMKLTTLPKVLRALEQEEYAIELPDEIIEKAQIPLKRMIEVTG